jgi:hypothetical protein
LDALAKFNWRSGSFQDLPRKTSVCKHAESLGGFQKRDLTLDKKRSIGETFAEQPLERFQAKLLRDPPHVLWSDLRKEPDGEM